MPAEMQALCQLATVRKRAGNERKPPRAGKDICLVFMRLNVFCQGGVQFARRKLLRVSGREDPDLYANTVRGFQFGT